QGAAHGAVIRSFRRCRLSLRTRCAMKGSISKSLEGDQEKNMGETIRLKAADGHELDAYVAYPTTKPIAGLVVIQEIFGVNRHIRSIVDGYAKDGFLAVAPALFDRV